MKRFSGLICLLLVSGMIIVACSVKVSNNNKLIPVSAEDFILTLHSDKDVYTEGDKVFIEAKLMYVGEYEQITIGHAASPLLFTMYEQTRDIAFAGVMNQPYINTTLTKNTPVKYKFTGVFYSNELNINKLSNEESNLLSNAIETMQFLEGKYVITVKANFNIDDQKFTEKDEYTFSKNLTIEIKK